VSVLLDAFALIALLTDEPAAETVEVLLRRGDAAMTVVNLAEALDVLRRIEKIPADRLESLTAPLLSKYVELRSIDEPIARRAADIRARRYHRSRAALSLADCILLAAVSRSDTLATADEPLLRAARTEGVSVRRLVR
jgi:PIN domain nuclease of toxin-antitoxin system